MLLQLEKVCKTFTLHTHDHKQVTSCENVNLSLHAGEFAGITGKSGAGKSTILKCIYRSYLPSGGRIWFESDRFGRIDIASAAEQQVMALRQREIGYVSQFLKVLPRVTAIQVVKESLMETGKDDSTAEAEARRILGFFRLPESLWDTYPNTFSGGEKLRLNLARSVVKRPKLLLLDEPTASLDDSSKSIVLDVLQELKREGVSMIGIFHDLDFMDRVVDSLYRMEAGMLRKGGFLW